MIYRLWKIEYDEKHAKMITKDYIYCQSKNQLMGAISRTLDEDETIEDIILSHYLYQQTQSNKIKL